MARENISMPSSQGGLVRHFDTFRSKIEIKPTYIILLIIIVIIIEAFLHLSRPLG